MQNNKPFPKWYIRRYGPILERYALGEYVSFQEHESAAENGLVSVFSEAITSKGDKVLQEFFKDRTARQEASKKSRRRAKERDDALRSLGLTKVRGAVSGKVYWE